MLRCVVERLEISPLKRAQITPFLSVIFTTYDEVKLRFHVINRLDTFMHL